MDTATKMLRIILGILLAIIAFFSGGILLTDIGLISLGLKVEWSYLFITIAYIILILGLLRLKKWALIIFGIIFGLSLVIVIILALKGESEQTLAEGFYFSISGLSILILPIATLLFIIKQIKRLFRN